MQAELVHISVCICTFKRPALLLRLLGSLAAQATGGEFTFSIVVADNDINESAKPAVSAFAINSPVEVIYCTEPKQNIALARNRAIENSRGEYIAFIDDDELPGKDWLARLLITSRAFNVDGVLGPVRPLFEQTPPKWIARGGTFNRPEHKTGYVLPWQETRSGNVLFKREIASGQESPFREIFGTGSEDVDFFRRMIQSGRVFVWCNEAVVQELIPPQRLGRSYQIRLALLRGGNSIKHEDANRALSVTKSYVALFVYVFSLPLLLVFGDHLFMEYLIRLCDHAGKLLQLLGINPVKKRST